MNGRPLSNPVCSQNKFLWCLEPVRRTFSLELEWCVSSDIALRNQRRDCSIMAAYAGIRGRAVFQASAGRLPGHGVSRTTILLVEDEVLVRMSLADQLRSAGYVVLEASSADEALDVLRSQRVRVVLSDIRLPGRLDGVELARAIRAQYPDVKIVLASGQSFSAGSWWDHDGFFPKPYDARRLIEHFKNLLG